ncbi:MAG: aminoacyl-tRNA hydrolase [Armatimonadota bacterium]|nr:aminoacyl-tRNA hydrolase [Armatimonadota bacterium]
MKMIVGLGNPGRQYAHTRHNVGFDVIDRFAKRRGVHTRTRRHRALIGRLAQDDEEVLLVKPQTYMNNSGSAVAALAREYGLQPSDIIVVYDDIDLPLGRLRIRAKGSSGGHKGVESIIQCLGSSEFPRIRIGIGRAGDAIDHVLSRFTRQEKTIIEPVIERAADALDVVLTDGLEAAMNIYNRKENDS